MLTGYALKRFSYFIQIMIRFPLRVRVFHERPFLSLRDSDNFIIKKILRTCQESRRDLSINFV